jgi:hypothetical protein
MDYNRLNALIYELILFIDRFKPGFKNKPWIKKILNNCLDDWAEFRTRVTLAELDEEIKELHAAWEREEAEHFEPLFIEEEPDDSEAQRLLGGPIRLSAPWTSDKNEPSS